MTVVRVGTTKQYSDNWDNIFGNGSGRTATKKKVAQPAKPSAKKKPAKKKAALKAGKKPARKK